MVPLIDVMLVLLVIFIVTAPLLTNTVKLDLPKADAAATSTKPDKIEFAIDAIGNLYWNNEPVSRQRSGRPIRRSRRADSRSRNFTCAPTDRWPTITSPRRWPTPRRRD